MSITVVMSREIDAPAATVWKSVRDFETVQVDGREITFFETKGAGVGMERTIGMATGKVVERLDRRDDAAMVYTYSITDDDNPLPIADHSSTGRITALSPKSCRLEWTVTFRPKHDEAAARKFIDRIYGRNLDRMAKLAG
jgi:hypothetical protein